MCDARRVKDDQLDDVVHVAESAIHGRGLHASRRIARDEYIGTFAGPLTKRNGEHVLWVYESWDDDAAAVGRRGNNMLRYVNHADPCNAMFDGFDLYAIRVIRPGEEITIDYGSAD